jgi:carbamoyl-phosphate synthase small subunit
LADGLIFRGLGVGATGQAVGEVCFNTAMTGYQEILTDPSYAAQIITFTFPHIGNVGVNNEDIENSSPAAATAARGAVFRAEITSPSNYRAQLDLGAWMKRRGVIGICGIDTRALAARIRDGGMPHGVIAHNPSGQFDLEAMQKRARDWHGLEGRDLAKDVTTLQSYTSDETAWKWNEGYGHAAKGGPHVVVIDYGVKRNILRLLAENGARVTVVPATATYEDVMAKRPDGVVLSNGPGDPAATGLYSIPVIRKLIESKTPTLGICLGHQMLALAAGAKTRKMAQGHHGANHPVKDLETGKVEIVSMNHGFTVDADTLPKNVEPTFVSLFDGTNSGIRLTDAPAFSVQHHPEASPGPQDSFGIFRKFVDGLRAA